MGSVSSCDKYFSFSGLIAVLIGFTDTQAACSSRSAGTSGADCPRDTLSGSLFVANTVLSHLYFHC